MARIAGGLYVLNIVGAAFAIGFVLGVLVVAGDPVTTAHNVVANELLYRFGLVANIIVTLTNIPLAVLFYTLFKVAGVAQLVERQPSKPLRLRAVLLLMEA